MSAIAIKDVLTLSVAERIQLVEDIWDTITVSKETFPVPDALRTELDRRVEDHQLNPDSGTDWETLKRRLGSSKCPGESFSNRLPKPRWNRHTLGKNSGQPVWGMNFCDAWMPASLRFSAIPNCIRWCIIRFAWRW
jgi:putative addiction module component (TIGR02574 family)